MNNKNQDSSQTVLSWPTRQHTEHFFCLPSCRQENNNKSWINLSPCGCLAPLLVSGRPAFRVLATTSIIVFPFELLLTVTPTASTIFLLEPANLLHCMSFLYSLFPPSLSLPPPLPRPHGVLGRCIIPKWDGSTLMPPPPLSLYPWSITPFSCISIEKGEKSKPPPTAEWLIQIIVAF